MCLSCPTDPDPRDDVPTLAELGPYVASSLAAEVARIERNPERHDGSHGPGCWACLGLHPSIGHSRA